jgi:hypothetical protein
MQNRGNLSENKHLEGKEGNCKEDIKMYLREMSSQTRSSGLHIHCNDGL